MSEIIILHPYSFSVPSQHDRWVGWGRSVLLLVFRVESTQVFRAESTIPSNFPYRVNHFTLTETSQHTLAPQPVIG